MCAAVKQVQATAFTDFATSVSKKCTNNPVFSAVCTGGFNPDAVDEAIKSLFKQAVNSKVAIADAISSATDFLLSFVRMTCGWPCNRLTRLAAQCNSRHLCKLAEVPPRPRLCCSRLLR